MLYGLSSADRPQHLPLSDLFCILLPASVCHSRFKFQDGWQCPSCQQSLPSHASLVKHRAMCDMGSVYKPMLGPMGPAAFPMLPMMPHLWPNLMQLATQVAKSHVQIFLLIFQMPVPFAMFPGMEHYSKLLAASTSDGESSPRSR